MGGGGIAGLVGGDAGPFPNQPKAHILQNPELKILL